MIDPDVLARATEDVRRATGDPVIAELFARSMAENLPAVAERLPDGTTFVLTGDIPAMWLRDSAAQLRPYLVLCADDPALQDVLIGVLHRQLEYVALDPYANAFNKEQNGAGHTSDETEMSPWVWERKYEIDSLCYPIELAYRLWRITGRNDVLDDRFRTAVGAILDLWTVELDHEARSQYRFQRHDEAPTDTLVREGRGRLTRPTGMSWSAFRPSDDATEHGFNVPGNMFASVVLGYLEAIAIEVRGSGEGVEGGDRRRHRGVRGGRPSGARAGLRLRGGRVRGVVADGRREHAESAFAADDRVRAGRRPDVPGDSAVAAQPGEPLFL